MSSWPCSLPGPVGNPLCGIHESRDETTLILGSLETSLHGDKVWVYFEKKKNVLRGQSSAELRRKHCEPHSIPLRFPEPLGKPLVAVGWSSCRVLLGVLWVQCASSGSLMMGVGVVFHERRKDSRTSPSPLENWPGQKVSWRRICVSCLSPALPPSGSLLRFQKSPEF